MPTVFGTLLFIALRFTHLSAFDHVVAGCDVDKSSVTYSCRSCKKSGFATSENFLEHSCCDGAKEKIVNQQLQQLQQLEDGQDQKLLDVNDIQWEDAAAGKK